MTGLRRAARLAVVLAVVALALPWSAAGQAPGTVRRIAILSFPTKPLAQTAAGIEAFRAELRALGWVEGRNVQIETRHVEREQLEAAAAEIVRERFDLIVTQAIPAALAAKKATATIPIVMATSADPVGSGLVESLARPGGNVTGLSFVGYELPGKRLDLLKEMVPRLGRVGALYPAGAASLTYVTQWVAENERAARTLGLGLKAIVVREPFDWEATLAAAKRDGIRALTLVESPNFVADAPTIASVALKHRLPAVFGLRAHVQAGGLMSYGGGGPDLWRRAAAYVDKILRGARPRDLPIEQVTKFDLVINAGTAKALGLTIPPALRLQATEILD